MCEVLVDYSWEFLNTNIWVFVEDKWRWLYAYATLYKIILLKLDPYESMKEDFEEKIVKLCDLGLNSTK